MFLAFIFVGSIILLAIMFGAGHLVTRRNVGIWQRINTGISIPWLAVLGFWLLTRTKQPSKEVYTQGNGVQQSWSRALFEGVAL